MDLESSVMSKRRLTRRQEWRIKKIQDERLERAEKRDQLVSQEIDNKSLGPEQQGLVIAHYGTQVEVEALQGTSKGQTLRCHLRTNLSSIVTGDKVSWQLSQDQSGVIVAVEKRQSELSRPDASGTLRPIGSNIDQIFIVIAPQPLTPTGLIDRYLVASEAAHITPILLINKVDLLNEQACPEIEDIRSLYAGIPYQIVTASSKHETMLSELRKLLRQRTSIFVGQSGVGKSSIINTLLPGTDLRTNELSTATGKGMHTTTTARLFHLPGGGDIIDSPGIREFGLEHIDPNTLAQGFKEFQPFLGYCKFRDCKHLHEPGCKLQLAVEEGKIDSRRLASYLRIAESLL